MKAAGTPHIIGDLDIVLSMLLDTTWSIRLFSCGWGIGSNEAGGCYARCAKATLVKGVKQGYLEVIGTDTANPRYFISLQGQRRAACRRYNLVDASTYKVP